MTTELICLTPKAIELSAYFYATSFLLMGVLIGLVIRNIRAKRRRK